MTISTEVAHRLDAATEARRLLDHPFYKAWAAGELTLEDLQHYSAQYFRQVEAFPSYLSNVADRLPACAAKTTVLENLSDEVDDDHLGLWLNFAAGVGAEAGEVRASAPEPETTGCVGSFTSGTAEMSVPFALGMLYGYESQTPGVAKTKVEGLRAHYGISGPALDYFELHGELDVEHSRELAEAIAEIASDEAALAEAEAGARAGAEAVWQLLDGVARVRQISCN
jgi:pyrroloquinoline-quinone synthase